MQPSPYSDTPDRDTVVRQLDAAHLELQRVKASIMGLQPRKVVQAAMQRKHELNEQVRRLQFQLSCHNDKSRRLTHCVGQLLAAESDEDYDTAYDALEAVYKDIKK